jgi:NADPH-dependent 7-cyano-7-deazaguanine reductase QueF
MNQLQQRTFIHLLKCFCPVTNVKQFITQKARYSNKNNVNDMLEPKILKSQCLYTRTNIEFLGYFQK